MFADDCLIFAKISSIAARRSLKVQDEFAQALGQQN
jgi:hypothetical protein